MDAQSIRELKERTGAGLAECKSALEHTEGDLNDAIRLLMEQGLVPKGYDVAFVEETKDVLEQRYRRKSRAGDAEATYSLARMIFLGEAAETTKTEYQDLLLEASRAGITKAQWDLAIFLMSRSKGRPPSADAIHWLEEAARAKMKPASRMLGLFHYLGRGVPRDKYRAGKYLSAGAESGSTHTEDGFVLGFEPRTDLAEKEFDESFETFEEVADWEIPEGKLWLGLLFSNVHYNLHDLMHSMNLFEEAAEGGLAFGYYLMGRQHQRAREKPTNRTVHEDEGPWKDPAKAAECFEKAAAEGVLEAMCALAEIHEKGTLGDPDEVQAARWYHRAGQAGDFGAVMSLQRLIHSGRGITTEEQEHMAAWRALARSGENTNAALITGMMCDVGRGTAHDPNDAVQWYYEAANSGSGVARYWLAAAYLGGYGMPRNTAEGVYWLTQAAEQGFRSAYAPLGLMLWYGHDVAEDQEAARRWLDQAASDGHSFQTIGVTCHIFPMDGTKPHDSVHEADAMYYGRAAALGFDVAQLLFGVLLIDGRGVPRDRELGLRWIEASTKNGLPEASKALQRLRSA